MPSARSLVKCGMPYFLGHCRGRFLIAADEGRNFHAGDTLERIEMFLTKGSLAGDTDLHYCIPLSMGAAAGPARGFTRGCSFAGGPPSVFENDVADRRVRGRHGVEAVDFVHLVVERAAHDSHITISMPSAPASRMYSTCGMRVELLRILGEVIQEGLVEFRIDQTRARPGNLVRHAAGAEDDHAQILGVGLRPPCGWRGRA